MPFSVFQQYNSGYPVPGKKILIVFRLSLKVSLRMRAYRADFRSLVSFINISAVVAFPAERSFVFESFSFTVVIKQLLIALFVSGLYLGYAAELAASSVKPSSSASSAIRLYISVHS